MAILLSRPLQTGSVSRRVTQWVVLELQALAVVLAVC